MAVNICTKFEPKIILSQESEDLQWRLTYPNNWGGIQFQLKHLVVTINFICYTAIQYGKLHYLTIQRRKIL